MPMKWEVCYYFWRKYANTSLDFAQNFIHDCLKVNKWSIDNLES